VRVIRGGFANNIADQPVEFTVDGKSRTVKTDASGRSVVSGLKSGARVKVVAVVGTERLESRELTVADTGVRIVLVATDPEAVKREAEDRRLAQGPAEKGLVVLGPESRVVLEFGSDRLEVFYIMQILNSARTPVDTGGPFLVDLPAEARGAGVLEGSSPKATVKGSHLTVTGPFAPGVTAVQVGFELPYSGGTARIEQRWPVQLQQLTVLVAQSGGLTLRSPQLAGTREVNDQGQAVILGSGPGVPPGSLVSLELSGLPHHAVWPRYLALSLAGAIAVLGIWAAATARSTRAAA